MAYSAIFKRIFLCVILGLFGYAGNWFNVCIFFNVDFLFGSVFSMLAILLLGRLYGIISALIAASCTYLLWNHPWAAINFTCEAIFVSWLFDRRKGNLVIYDLIYWLGLGMPLVFLFYHFVMGITVQATMIVMLKQAINGLINTLLAITATLIYKFIRKPSGYKVSYKELVFVAISIFALLPAMFLSISNIRAYEKNDMEMLRARTASITDIVQKNVSAWINDYSSHVQVLARFIGDPNIKPFAEMQRYVEGVKEGLPALKGLGVFDNRSVSVSYSPLEHDNKSNIGIDMSFRKHIELLRHIKKPHITDILISKLGYPSPIVILLSPIIISGEYKGYCSGVVETSKLQEFLSNLKTKDIQITLVDGQNKVIVSTSTDIQPSLPFDRPYIQPGLRVPEQQLTLWQPELISNVSPIPRWRNSFLFSAVPISDYCQWRLIVEAPLLPIVEDISRYCLNWLVLLGILTSIVIFLSFMLSHGFIANIRKLQTITRIVPKNITDASMIQWPNTTIEELSELAHNFQQLISALANQIAEQKITEIALRESEERLQLVMEGSQLGYWDWNIETGEVSRNERWAEMLGYTLEEVSHNVRQWTDLHHPDDCAAAWKSINDHLEGKTPAHRIEYRMRAKNGEYKWILDQASIVKWNTEGKPIRMSGTHTDITERKQSESELVAKDALLQAMVRNLPFDFWVRDTEQRIIMQSDESIRFWGDLVGTTPNDEQSHEDIVKHWEANNSAVMAGKVLSEDCIYTSKTGEQREFHSLVAPIREGENILGILGINIDITERKQAERETQILQTQLIQAQKMEAIGTLAGGIAHDFNNILGAVLGYTEMAREASPENSNIARYLDKVLTASTRAADLVKQILAFSRQSNDARVALEPVHLVKEALKLLRPMLPSTIKIIQNLDEQTRNIHASPTQIHQIVMNLCTNAFHAMESTGGTIEIVLTDCFLPTERLQHYPSINPGNFVELIIKDSGPGIPKDIQERIFEPYFTTKATGKGTGLGLSIVHGIITSLGGFITCDSEQGNGSTFSVFIPASESESIPDGTPDNQDLKGIEHILLVDDEEMLADMGKALLECLGYRVTIQYSSIEALTTFQSQPYEFDAVVTDQTMPGLTGIEMARRMLQIRPNIPIILCTGYSSIIDEDQVYAEGIKGFVMKPVSKKDLGLALRKVLDFSSSKRSQA
nr:PAS domain-containing protein [uncultured Desulfobulbus sp.]